MCTRISSNVKFIRFLIDLVTTLGKLRFFLSKIICRFDLHRLISV